MREKKVSCINSNGFLSSNQQQKPHANRIENVHQITPAFKVSIQKFRTIYLNCNDIKNFYLGICKNPCDGSESNPCLPGQACEVRNHQPVCSKGILNILLDEQLIKEKISSMPVSKTIRLSTRFNMQRM